MRAYALRVAAKEASQKLMPYAVSVSALAGHMQPNSALLPDAFSSLRCACGAAKRER